jgi:hypothetical protein
VKISWDQAHAWRLQRQFVDPRGNAEAVDIISRLCGVQAQVASSAELGVRIRQAEPEAGAVKRGIADGTLVKTWRCEAPCTCCVPPRPQVSYGPSTPDVFDAWLLRNALKKATLRGWFAGLGDQLTKVDVEGQEAYILSEHADDLARTKASRSVRLLGAFDQYVLGPGTGDPQILPAEHRAKVSRAAGWISPIVVVAGRITGVWELIDNQVRVSFFPGADRPSAKDLEAEVTHVSRARGRDHLTP